MIQSIQEQVFLRDYTTFKIGGPAKFFCSVGTVDELGQAIRWAKEKGEKVFILGGGSNVLFSDDGFDGLVVRMQNDQIFLTENKTAAGKRSIICQAGVNLSRLLGFAAENGLTGLEWAAGIYGTVGGAVRGNAGAFGGEMKDTLFEAKAIRVSELANGEVILHTLTKEECCFGYRDSLFKQQPDWIFWEGTVELAPGDSQEIKAGIQDTLQKRQEKHPSLAEYPSAGSIFKNAEATPEVIAQFEQDKGIKARGTTVPAGWLIESCGLKGKQIGGAMVSEKQANFIVNTGNATAKDVLMLISIIKEKVRNRYNIQLQEELETVL